MRSPVLDLDSVYGRGPALDPYYTGFLIAAIRRRPSSCNSARTETPDRADRSTPPGVTAIPTNFDVPRVLNGTNTAVSEPDSTFTAIIGDPRNDENLIVSQFHHAMLAFHNRVVDLLVTAAFTGDIFSEAKRIVTQHYQWCVVHDFLERICGARGGQRGDLIGARAGRKQILACPPSSRWRRIGSGTAWCGTATC